MSLKIAITFPEKSSMMEQIWYGSGLAQNLKFYYELFELMGHDVYFMINESYPITHKNKSYRTIETAQALNDKIPLNIIVEAGTVIALEHKNFFKQECDTRIIGLRCGNQLFQLMEDLLTNKNLLPRQITIGQDLMWLLPHHGKQTEFIATLHACPTLCVPYIWESDFIEKQFSGKKLPQPADIKIMEPNISVLKNLILPLTIIEQLYRDTPDIFGTATFFNTENFIKNEAFLSNFVQNLEVLQSTKNKTYFADRKIFNHVFENLSVLLGFQHENELNYLYNEALYTGIPLVHNAPSYAEVGYYYPEFEVNTATEQIRNAVHHHDVDSYIKRNHDFLHQFSIHNPMIQREYQLLLEQALATPV